MFTVKAVHLDEDGRTRMHLHEAVDVDVFPNGTDMEARPHVCFQSIHGDYPAFVVDRNVGDTPCVAVFVENASGKTTESLRAA